MSNFSHQIHFPLGGNGGSQKDYHPMAAAVAAPIAPTYESSRSSASNHHDKVKTDDLSTRETFSTKFLRKSRRGFPPKSPEPSLRPQSLHTACYRWNRLGANSNDNQPSSVLKPSTVLDNDACTVPVLNYSNTSSSDSDQLSPESDVTDENDHPHALDLGGVVAGGANPGAIFSLATTNLGNNGISSTSVKETSSSSPLSANSLFTSPSALSTSVASSSQPLAPPSLLGVLPHSSANNISGGPCKQQTRLESGVIPTASPTLNYPVPSADSDVVTPAAAVPAAAMAKDESNSVLDDNLAPFPDGDKNYILEESGATAAANNNVGNISCSNAPIYPTNLSTQQPSPLLDAASRIVREKGGTDTGVGNVPELHPGGANFKSATPFSYEGSKAILSPSPQHENLMPPSKTSTSASQITLSSSLKEPSAGQADLFTDMSVLYLRGNTAANESPRIFSHSNPPLSPDRHVASLCSPAATSPRLPSSPTRDIPITPQHSPSRQSQTQSDLPVIKTGVADSSVYHDATTIGQQPQRASSPLSPNHTDDELSMPTTRPTNMVRKKSGELVKPSLKLVRHRSLPSSPSKMVHFDSNLVSVRSFFRSEKPAAVNSTEATNSPHGKVTFHWDDDSDSAGLSPSDTSDDDNDNDGGMLQLNRFKKESPSWELRFVNFKSGTGVVADGEHRMVYLDRVFLSSDKQTMIGHVYVKNICFQKSVYIRYTLDHWKTVTEVKSEFNKDLQSPKQHFNPFGTWNNSNSQNKEQGYDRFTFVVNVKDIPAHVLATNPMFFCIHYVANNQSFWDNNNGMNFEVSFSKSEKNKAGAPLKKEPSPRSARVQTRRRGSRSNKATATAEGTEQKRPMHHRRLKTEGYINPDIVDDFEFGDDSNGGFFNSFSLKSSQNKPDDVVEGSRPRYFSGNFTDDDSDGYLSQLPLKSNKQNKSSGQVKTKKKLASRYSFGSTWNDMISRQNPATHQNTAINSEHSESESEVGGLKKLVFPKLDRKDTTKSKHSAADSQPQKNTGLIGSHNPSGRPAWDSSSYKDLLDKYCFFSDQPAASSSVSKTPAKRPNDTSSIKASKTSDEPADSSWQSPSPPTASSPEVSEKELSKNFSEELRV